MTVEGNVSVYAETGYATGCDGTVVFDVVSYDHKMCVRGEDVENFECASGNTEAEMEILPNGRAAAAISGDDDPCNNKSIDHGQFENRLFHFSLFVNQTEQYDSSLHH